MEYLDQTLQTPHENLACDEALLDCCEEGFPDEILRFWEPRQHFVVLGYSNKARSEVNLDSCQRLGIPVLRRCTGGGTVLQGPGCLNYALLLKIQSDSPLANITKANAFIMNRNRNALNPLLGGKVLIQGHTDLTLQGTKFPATPSAAAASSSSSTARSSSTSISPSSNKPYACLPSNHPTDATAPTKISSQTSTSPPPPSKTP